MMVSRPSVFVRMLLIVVLVFPALLLGVSPALAAPPSEREALIALYEATDGPNWETSTGWLGDEGTECEWHGVECSDDEWVTRLDLRDNQLSGEIPPELAQLSQLEWLNFRINQLSGEIPPELAQLSQLEWLSLEGNQLSGNIPSELAQLSQLKFLSLGGNQLSGEILPELAQLSQLRTLNLSGNPFSGMIPTELAQLSQLEYLAVGGGGGLSGEIPGELAQLSQLKSLSLNGSQLSGEIPTELSQLSQLQHLHLDSNQLSGEIPPELTQLSQMEDLRLGANQLSGEIPTELVQLSQLSLLNLSHNEFIGEIPPALTQLTELESLALSQNCLSTNDPDLIAFLDDVENSDDWRDQRDDCSPSVGGDVTLTVNITGTGTGTVTSTPVGIDCGSLCQATFPEASTVTLTATPGAGSSFDYWTFETTTSSTDECFVTAGIGTCVFTLDQAQSVTATFTADDDAPPLIEDDEIRLNIEEPRDGATYQGVANLRGWAVAPIGIDHIEAIVNAEHSFPIPHGGYRQDVAGHPQYGSYPGAANSGFSMTLNYSDPDSTPPLGPGEHSLTIRAYDVAGGYTEKTLQFTVIGFDNANIKHALDDPKVWLDSSSTHIEATGPSAFEITGIEIDDQLYDLSLRWRDQQQGFAIEAIRGHDDDSESFTGMDRYRILGADDGIVEDVETGLQWMRCSLGQVWDQSAGSCMGSGDRYQFYNVQSAAAALNASGGYAGYTDWRVPSIEALSSLVYCSSGEPAYFPGGITPGAPVNFALCARSEISPTILQEAFPDIPNSSFWSSSLRGAHGSASAWYVNFDDHGYALLHWTGFDLPVRLVRAGQ